MKRSGIILVWVLFIILCLGLSLNASAAKLGPPEGRPSIYCNVVEKPNPLLLGGWSVDFVRPSEKVGDNDFNTVKFWLVKDNDQYGLYFFRTSHGGRKRYAGWQDWTVNGNEITSDKGMRFFVKEGEVYFSWNDIKPLKMKRI